MLVEPSEEEIHAYFLRALAYEGKLKEAYSHYECITSILYNKYGTKPSNELRNAYQLMNKISMERSYFEFNTIENLIDNDMSDTVGAFVCDPKIFQSLYTVQVNQNKRKGQPVFLLFIELPIWSTSINPWETVDIISVLSKSLRAGDSITQWSDSENLSFI